MNKDRDISIDLLRILCCFLVLGIHVTPLYDAYIAMDIPEYEKYSALLIQSLVRSGLPVFFMISGMYLLNSKIDNIASFYKKRLTAIIIPFLIYSFIHFFGNSKGSINIEIIIIYLSDLMSSTGISMHFWFVYSIIGIYLISPFINMLLEKINEYKSIMVSIIFIISISFYNTYLDGIISGLEVPYFGMWTSYFILGGLIARLPKIKLNYAILFFILSYFLTCLSTFVQFNFNHAFFRSFDSGLNMYMLAFFLCMIFKNLELNISDKIKKIIYFISSRTYGIYLIHILVLTVIIKNYDTSWYVGNITSYTIFMTLIIFLISLLISSIVDKVICEPVIKRMK
ncbi:acyltransferase [Xenorhabdus bovienii]|nr:acyltransferase [Xenorhabdus bovienii]